MAEVGISNEVGLRVRDIMRTNVVTTNPKAPLTHVVEEMRRHQIGCLPVVENDSPVGMVTDRDVLIRGLALTCELRVGCVADVMSTGLVAIGPDCSVVHARSVMIATGVRRLIVVDVLGRLLGLISWPDITYGQRPRPASSKITFYRRMLDSRGHQHDVETSRLYVSPGIPDADVTSFAIERFEHVNGGKSWRTIADNYKVSEP